MPSNPAETSALIQPSVITPDAGFDYIAAFGPYKGRVLVDRIVAVSLDTIDHVCQVAYDDGTFFNVIGSFTLPASQGEDGSPSVDVLAAALPVGWGSLLLAPGVTLKIRAVVAVLVSNEIDLIAYGGFV